MSDKLRFGEILVRAGVLDRSQLESVLREQGAMGGDLGELLVARGCLEESAMLQAVAKALNRPVVSLESVQPDPRTLSLLTRELCVEHVLFPIEVERSKTGDHLHVAMANPLDVRAIKVVMQHARLRIQPLVCSAREIKASIGRFYGGPVASAAPSAPPPMQTNPAMRAPAGMGVAPSSPRMPAMSAPMGASLRTSQPMPPNIQAAPAGAGLPGMGPPQRSSTPGGVRAPEPPRPAGPPEAMFDFAVMDLSQYDEAEVAPPAPQPAAPPPPLFGSAPVPSAPRFPPAPAAPSPSSPLFGQPPPPPTPGQSPLFGQPPPPPTPGQSPLFGHAPPAAPQQQHSPLFGQMPQPAPSVPPSAPSPLFGSLPVPGQGGPASRPLDADLAELLESTSDDSLVQTSDLARAAAVPRPSRGAEHTSESTPGFGMRRRPEPQSEAARGPSAPVPRVSPLGAPSSGLPPLPPLPGRPGGSLAGSGPSAGPGPSRPLPPLPGAANSANIASATPKSLPPLPPALRNNRPKSVDSDATVGAPPPNFKVRAPSPPLAPASIPPGVIDDRGTGDVELRSILERYTEALDVGRDDADALIEQFVKRYGQKAPPRPADQLQGDLDFQISRLGPGTAKLLLALVRHLTERGLIDLAALLAESGEDQNLPPRQS